jgi:foldase protein PrsA
MAFCAAIATAAVLGACGSGVPGDAVAQVGGTSVTKAAFNHWLVVANNAATAATNSAPPPVPVPPYTACIAAARKATPTETASEAKVTCAQDYQSLVTEVVNFLVQEDWVQGEAYDRGVKVTPAQVEKAYESQRKISTPPLKTTKQLNTFLAAAGETVADLKWRTLVSLEADDISLKVEKAAQKVTTAQIASYYSSHLSTLGTPETRDVELIETTTQATATKVMGLLASGSTYAQLAPKYSIDPTSKNVGGKLTGVRAGELTAQVSAAIFAAKVGVLSGPIKTPFGYYVFTVESITPAKVPTLAAETTTIRQTLASAAESKATAALESEFVKKWTPRTTCASGYIVAPSCGNAPKTSTSSSTTPATGATSG